MVAAVTTHNESTESKVNPFLVVNILTMKPNWDGQKPTTHDRGEGYLFAQYRYDTKVMMPYKVDSSEELNAFNSVKVKKSQVNDMTGRLGRYKYMAPAGGLSRAKNWLDMGTVIDCSGEQSKDEASRVVAKVECFGDKGEDFREVAQNTLQRGGRGGNIGAEIMHIGDGNKKTKIPDDLPFRGLAPCYKRDVDAHYQEHWKTSPKQFIKVTVAPNVDDGVVLLMTMHEKFLTELRDIKTKVQ